MTDTRDDLVKLHRSLSDKISQTTADLLKSDGKRIAELEKEIDFQRRRANSAESGWKGDIERWQLDIVRAEKAEAALTEAQRERDEERELCAGIALAIDSGRGNEKVIAAAIRSGNKEG